MNSVQKSLTSEGDYSRTVDPSTVKKELKDSIKDRESLEWMIRQVDTMVENGEPISIRSVYQQQQLLKDTLDDTMDRSLAEFGRSAVMGASFLKDFLVRRANELASGITPGAQKLFEDAIG